MYMQGHKKLARRLVFAQYKSRVNYLSKLEAEKIADQQADELIGVWEMLYD